MSASHFPPGSVMGLHFRLDEAVCVIGTMDLQFCSIKENSGGQNSTSDVSKANKRKNT